MSTKYNYIGDDGKHHGPVSADEMLKLGNEKKNRGGSMVYCREGSDDWKDFNETYGAIIAAAKPPPEGEESPATFIQRVRSQTSYGTLRSVLAVVLALVIIGVVIAAGIVIGTASSGMRANDSAIVILPALVIAAIVIVLAVALKQMLTTVVDMADTLIEQNRKKTK